MKNKALWTAQTAMCLALLTAAQALSGPLGQLVTGSLVNAILIVSVLAGGGWSGAAVGSLSPVLAFMLGIGPALPPVIPFVLAGNLALVIVWRWVGGQEGRWPRLLAAVVAAAAAKCLVLYLGVVRLCLPMLELPEKQRLLLSAMFSLPQLFTALAGGGLAMLLAPPLRRMRLVSRGMPADKP